MGHSSAGAPGNEPGTGPGKDVDRKMNDWRVPLGNAQVPDEDLESVRETYHSGWLNMGPRTEELEAEFAEYTGAAHCLAVNSCSAALHLACIAVGVEPGDRVVMPAMTFVATPNAVAYCGGEPVFADIAGIHEPWLSAEATAAAMTTALERSSPSVTAAIPVRSLSCATLLSAAGWPCSRTRPTAAARGSEGATSAPSARSGPSASPPQHRSWGGRHGGDRRPEPRREDGEAALARDLQRCLNAGIAAPAPAMTSPRSGSTTASTTLAQRSPWSICAASTPRPRSARRSTPVTGATWRISGHRADLPPGPDSRHSHLLFTAVLGEEIDRDRFRALLAERGVRQRPLSPRSPSDALRPAGARALKYGELRPALCLAADLSPNGGVAEGAGGELDRRGTTAGARRGLSSRQ